jgi:hypothetical protein
MMQLPFYYNINTFILCTALFLIMLASIEAGRWFAKNRSHEFADNPGTSSITASLYGLLGLMLAFTFGMSGQRFKDRKELLVSEANAIGTAVLRVQLYADSVQPKFREHFEHYVDARIAYFEAYVDTTKIWMALKAANAHSDSLWKVAAENSRLNGNLAATNQMIPALNEMFDLRASEFWGEYTRTPGSILTMLFLLSVAAAFVSGHTSVGKGKLDRLMAVGFCLLTSMVIFFIIDLDKPRRGIVNIDKNVKAITELQYLFKPRPSDPQ